MKQKTKRNARPNRPPSVFERHIRIFLVDDHPITRRGLRHLIENESDLSVCGESSNASSALDAVPKLNPNLVIADIKLPKRSGLSMIKDINALAPGVPILIFAMHDEELFAERVLRAGAQGYLMKSAEEKSILKAIRQVASGAIYVSSHMSSRILDAFVGRRRQTGNPTLSRLTDREFEVFQLLGQGLTTSDISKRLNLSSKTVDTHRLHIKEKLELNSLPELMNFAVRWTASEELT